ncbi:ABC transporter substrate-binding protein [Segnochrobactraceae bacterium EtOH-i3]
MRMRILKAAASLALAAGLITPALAEEVVKIGLILPMTGPSASTGRQVSAGAKLYMAEHGDTVAGKKIELILKDDTGTADVTKRLAQELVVRDKVNVLAGFGLTPLALAAAPVATQAKVPEVVMAAATSIITEKSPFIVRSSFTLPQVTKGIAQWAGKNEIKRASTLVTDYGPGIDAEKTFVEVFGAGGGEVVSTARVPLQNPDFGPFLQKVKDEKPDAVFVFVPSGFGGVFMKQFRDRGLADAGVKLIVTGDVTDDDLLPAMGEAAVGVTSSHHYSAAHPSEANKAFVAAFEKANDGMRPNFMAVGGYDGMRLIYEALKKTDGDTNGVKLVDAMKGMSFESVRGPVTIDPETRDIVQNVYIRKVEAVDGKLYNVEFDVLEAVPDPVKAAAKKG